MIPPDNSTEMTPAVELQRKTLFSQNRKERCKRREKQKSVMFSFGEAGRSYKVTRKKEEK